MIKKQVILPKLGRQKRFKKINSFFFQEEEKSSEEEEAMRRQLEENEKQMKLMAQTYEEKLAAAKLVN